MGICELSESSKGVFDSCIGEKSSSADNRHISAAFSLFYFVD